jgi:hypothetical protein
MDNHSFVSVASSNKNWEGVTAVNITRVAEAPPVK